MPIEYTHGLINCSRESLVDQLRQTIKPSRFEHVLRVESTALSLAEKLDADLETVSVVALMHDFAKEMPADSMLELALKFWPNEELKLANDNIWHGPAAAQLCKDQFGCNDQSMLNAIAGHTIGWFEMDQLAKILYMADYIEPGRNFKGVEKARQLTNESLDKACEFKMTETIRYLIKQRVIIFPGTIDIYNAWIEQKMFSEERI